MDKDTVTITRKEYDSLMKDAETLAALNAAIAALEDGGIDNWEWYHQSLKDAGLLEDEED